MDVSGVVWGLTIAAIVVLLAFDFFFHVRKAHAPTLREAAVWSGVYVGLALLFGTGVLVFGGAQAGSEYFAGYVTEKALSVDNLFVFLIIMASFRVPREDQQKVLLFGIVFALVARTGFIFLGAALINSFAWVFYVFGLILLLTAGNMLKPEGEESHSADNFIIRMARTVFHTTDHYDGDKLGGFNWSSQHLDQGGVGWVDRGSRCRRRRPGRDGSGPRTGRCGRRCARRAAPSRRELCSGSSGV
jgi:tellurite resistance protein TerC